MINAHVDEGISITLKGSPFEIIAEAIMIADAIITRISSSMNKSDEYVLDMFIDGHKFSHSTGHANEVVTFDLGAIEKMRGDNK